MHFHGSSEQKIPLRALPEVTVPFTSLTHWAAAYVGRPYRLGARGPDAYDCWGILVEVYESQFGIQLPLLPGISAAAAIAISREIDLASKEEWDQVGTPFDGCAVALSQARAYHHVGMHVDVEGGKILHAMEGQGVMIENLRRMRLRGFRRIAYFKHRLWPTS